MTQLLLSTGNIVSGGPSIIRKPGAYRSNLELTNSLRSNFLAAQQDYAELDSEALTNGSHQTNGNGHVATIHEVLSSPEPTTAVEDNPPINGHCRPPVPIWTERDGDRLYIPRIHWEAAGLQEERDQYDITVKLFFLPGAPVEERAAYIHEALDLVRQELSAGPIDLVIASFPGMKFEGDCEWEADRRNALQGNLDEEVATWQVLEELHRAGAIRSLGISEFGSEKLTQFMGRVSVPPAVDQINVRDCCNVPPPLRKLAKLEGVELLVHTDCTDILPSGTLRQLLGQGFQGAGVLEADPVKAETETELNGHGPTGVGLKGEVIPEWVVKYTAFVKDRGVIENKGYFAAAKLRE